MFELGAILQESDYAPDYALLKKFSIYKTKTQETSMAYSDSYELPNHNGGCEKRGIPTARNLPKRKMSEELLGVGMWM